MGDAVVNVWTQGVTSVFTRALPILSVAGLE
jgi:hypothetical protein